MDKQSTTRYNTAPTISKGRTRFDLSHEILTTMNTGELVCCLAEPVYPGDTFSLNQASLTRLETSIHQTMDNAYLEFAYFFVPLKEIWKNFPKLLGANDDPWTQQNQYIKPQLNLYWGSQTTPNVKPHSLLNDIGVPSGNLPFSTTKPFSIDATPLRSIFKIYNDWFRDENYDSVIYYDDGDSNVNFYGQVAGSGANAFLFNGANINPSEERLKVNRYHDLFSTALPSPQKGQEVSIGLSGLAPIVADPSGAFHMLDADGDSSFTNKDVFNSSVSGTGTSTSYGSTTLMADLDNATAVTINQLRLAIATQAIAERDARGGTRLNEQIYSIWGVRAPSLELNRSEFLGGKRIPISMMEVIQTSETGTTVLGTDAGHSKTIDNSDGFVKSFHDYGWVIGFCFVRTQRSYSQGIDRKLCDKGRFTMYDPMFDQLGEVGVMKSEIYALGQGYDDVWGYQEPWYHLKERNNRFSGYFQPGINGTLDTWHYGDSYQSIPTMSADWLKETANNVDRTIAVTSAAPYSFQWSINVHFDLKVTRTMHKYAVPNTFGFGY